VPPSRNGIAGRSLHLLAEDPAYGARKRAQNFSRYILNCFSVPYPRAVVKPQAWLAGFAALWRTPFAALKTQKIAACYNILSSAPACFAAALLLRFS
jgi:hypothetical protein